ncbi:MAG: lipopolysaccharide biosynthesis protein [Pseudomonadota bacterium]|jgi:PST family polysaccharide transporter
MSNSISSAADSDSGKVLLGFKWTYISVALQGVLKLGVLMALARLLTPRDFGVLGFALICTNFIERIGQLGVAQALIQIKEINGDIVATANRLCVVFGILSSLAVCLVAAWVASFFSEPLLEPVLQVLAWGCLLEAMAAVPDARLQRGLRFKEIMLIDNVAYAVAMLGVCVTLAALGMGVWALVAATMALKLVRCLMLRALSSEPIVGVWRLDHAQRLIALGAGFSAARLLNFFSLQGDNFVVGRLLGVEALGMYNRAYQLMTLPAMYVGQVFERVMFPAMARKQGSPERLRDEFLLSLEAITIVALPAGVVMFILAPEIVLVGFGKGWMEIVPVVSVLSFGVFFRTAYKCSDTVVRSLGAVYRYAARQALYAAWVIGGAAVGASLAGLRGVGVGVVAAVGFNYLSMTRLSTRLLKLPIAEVCKAHCAGIWVSVLVWGGLASVVEYLRAYFSSALVTLVIASIVALVSWSVGLALTAVFSKRGVTYRAVALLRQAR